MLKEYDSQRRFLAQHSIALLLRHFFEWLQHCSSIAMLCCAKNRCCESSCVTILIYVSRFRWIFFFRMGLWIAKLAGHKDDAKVQLRKPDSVLAYILAFGSVFLVLFVLLVGIVLTAIRIYKIFVYRKQSEENLTVRAWEHDDSLQIAFS